MTTPTARYLMDWYRAGSGATVFINQQDYLAPDGYGRYAYYAAASAVQVHLLNRFGGDLALVSTQGTQTINEVRLSNFITDIHSADYASRATAFGAQAFDLTDSVSLSADNQYHIAFDIDFKSRECQLHRFADRRHCNEPVSWSFALRDRSIPTGGRI